MYDSGFSLAPPHRLSLQAQAFGLLAKLTRSPAGIFVPGQGYLQALDNKLTYSRDFSNAAWLKNGTATAPSSSTLNLPAFGDYVYEVIPNQSASTALTIAAELSGSGTVELSYFNTVDAAAKGNLVVTLTSTPTIYATNLTTAAATGTTYVRIGRTGVGTATAVTIGGAVCTPGTYTAQQIAALGIPWTLGTASVSLSLGPELAAANSATLTGQVGNVIAMNTAAVVSKNYWVGYNYNLSSGSIQAGSGSTYSLGSIQNGPSSGYYSYAAVGNGTGTAGALYSNGGVGSISNFSVREILSTPCPVYTNASVYLPGSTVTSYGAELVTDNWTVTSGYNNIITSHTASSVSSTASTAPTSAARIFVNFTTKIGTTYKVTATPSGNNGNVYVRAGSDGVGTVLASVAAGALSTTFAATTTNSSMLLEALGGLAMDWSGISVREVITTSSVVSGLSSNNFTLSDGSTGYSAVDGTCGLALDAAGAVGEERVTNGDFASGSTGWTSTNITFSGGSANANSVADTYLYQDIMTIGATYLVVVDYNFTSGSTNCYAGSNSGSGSAILPMTGLTGSGRLTGYIVASSNRFIVRDTDGCIASFDNISVKQVTGIHATQATAGNRPAERRGLYNLALWSGDFTNAAWAKNLAPTITANYGAAPDGTITAQRFQSTATSSGVLGTLTYVAGSAYTQAYLIKDNGGSVKTFNLGISTGAFISGSGDRLFQFDCSTGAVSSVNAVFTSATATAIGNGYWLVVANFAATASASAYQIVYGSALGVDALVYRSATFQGTLTAAQILAEGGIPLTTSAAASNSAAGRYWWQFDGSNDSLALGSVPLAHSDDYCVGFALRADNTTSFTAYGQASGAATTNILVGVASGAPQFFCRDSAGTTVNLSTGVVSAGQTCVVSGRKVGNTRTVALNGSVTQTDTTALLADTMLAAAIGCRPSSTPDRFANGAVGAGYVIKGVVSDADRLTLDRWVASAMPAGPTF